MLTTIHKRITSEILTDPKTPMNCTEHSDCPRNVTLQADCTAVLPVDLLSSRLNNHYSEEGVSWSVCPRLSFWVGEAAKSSVHLYSECVVQPRHYARFISRAYRWARFRRRFEKIQFEQWLDVPFSAGRVVILSSNACSEVLDASTSI